MISESFVSINSGAYSEKEFSNPVQLGPRIWRVSHGGKLFLLKTAKDESAEALDMLKREYDLGCNLQHPHIVSPIEWLDESPAGPAILMEYWKGRTLGKYISENPPKAELERVFSQLLEAVAYLHRQSVIHNDIKPDNILITDVDNDIKLLDFGFSDDDGHYLEKGMGGTRKYSSPELRAHGEIDCRSDIYSIGIVMKDLFGKKYSGISNKCSANSPEKRYSNVNELQKVWAKRNRTLSVALAAAGIAALIALVALVFNFRSKDNAEKQQLLASTQSLQKLVDSLQFTTDSLQVFADHYQQRLEEEANRKVIFDDICARLDSAWVQAAQETKDMLNHAKYREFCTNIVVDIPTRMSNLLDELSKGLEGDLQAQSNLQQVYMTRMNAFVEEFEAKFVTMPSFYEADIPEDEKEFYRFLIEANQPYRPYIPSED